MRDSQAVILCIILFIFMMAVVSHAQNEARKVEEGYCTQLGGELHWVWGNKYVCKPKGVK